MCSNNVHYTKPRNNKYFTFNDINVLENNITYFTFKSILIKKCAHLKIYIYFSPFVNYY